MKIFTDAEDTRFVPSNRTVSIISCGYLAISERDTMTVRKNGRRDWSLFYCEDGKICFDGTDVKKGQAWIYPPNVPQKYIKLARDNTKYYYIHFTGSELDALADSTGIKNGLTVVGEELSGLFSAICTEFKKRDSLSLLKCEYLMLKLLYKIASASDSREKQTALQNVLEAMVLNYDKPYNAEHYASISCVSVGRFNHMFKEAYGVSPKAYFINLKIENACKLLENTDMSVAEISNAVGYTDVFGFSKIFKSRTGYSPSGYKRCYK
ncbi:MAG: helix-turn-helix transcriptional regulator [Clostridia bacterium]|nr:helix-turn-helix transcriptional regulator [Clostridia bacterium]